LTVALRALLRELLLLVPPRVARELGAATCAPHAAAPAAAAVGDNERCHQLHLPTTTTTSTPPTPLRSSLCNLLHTLLPHATPLASPHRKSSTAALLARRCSSSSSSSSSSATTTEHKSAAASSTTTARGGGRQAAECSKGIRAFVLGICHPIRNKSGPTLIAYNSTCHLRATLPSLLLASFRALLLHDFMRNGDH
jgi:hypothetical protein